MREGGIFFIKIFLSKFFYQIFIIKIFLSDFLSDFYYQTNNYYPG